MPSCQAVHVSADSPANHPLPDDDAFSDISDTSATPVISTEKDHWPAAVNLGTIVDWRKPLRNRTSEEWPYLDILANQIS